MSYLFGMFHLSKLNYIAVVLILTHITVISITIYLHRCQAHRSVDLHPIVSHFFRFWLWLTTSVNTKEWVAVHRKHHVTCETEDDPHSPQIYGIKMVLWRGVELYKKEAKNKETLDRFGKKTPEDWIEKHLYYKYQNVGIFLLLAIDLVLFGVVGLTIWAIQMVCMPLLAAGVINGIGHYWGYRNSEINDESRNILPIGIIIGGEELHNNHHTYPGSAKLSYQKWEFDIGWFYIRIFELMKLAKARHVCR